MTNELTEHQHLISTVRTLSQSLRSESFYLLLLIISSFEAYTMWLKAFIETSRMCATSVPQNASSIPVHHDDDWYGLPLYRDTCNKRKWNRNVYCTVERI